MWKRERMMVDVISLQRTKLLNDENSQTYNSSEPINNTQLLQNRDSYPFHGLRDDANNFYAGNAYNINGNLADTKKRSITTATVTTATLTSTKNKKQKQDYSININHNGYY